MRKLIYFLTAGLLLTSCEKDKDYVDVVEFDVPKYGSLSLNVDGDITPTNSSTFSKNSDFTHRLGQQQLRLYKVDSLDNETLATSQDFTWTSISTINNLEVGEYRLRVEGNGYDWDIDDSILWTVTGSNLHYSVDETIIVEEGNNEVSVEGEVFQSLAIFDFSEITANSSLTVEEISSFSQINLKYPDDHQYGSHGSYIAYAKEEQVGYIYFNAQMQPTSVRIAVDAEDTDGNGRIDWDEIAHLELDLPNLEYDAETQYNFDVKYDPTNLSISVNVDFSQVNVDI